MRHAKSYIIRVYHDATDAPRLLAGIVEDPESGEKRRFSSYDELLEILRQHQQKREGSV